jgi:hypothetical protein
MTFRAWAIAVATVLAVLPWTVALAGTLYAFFCAPVTHFGSIMRGSFALAFWIAVACFATSVSACVDALQRLPWMVSAVVSFCYMLVFAAMHGVRWFAVSTG